ncbi:MAG TPA: hypothetical protein VK914_13410 [bacterium]|jgi:glutathione synthase/RimK-type ligase-like ATP-grasp enzyme|nr:hypothetical protein [bacterium]
MLLIVTSTRDATADYLVGRIKKTKLPFVRLDTDCELDSLDIQFGSNGPLLKGAGWSISPNEVTSLWFRRPTPLGSDADPEPKAEHKWILEEWSCALEGFLSHIKVRRWINHPTNNIRAGSKMEQLTRARSFGLNVPESIVTRDQEVVRSFWEQCDKKIIVKPLSAGLVEEGDGISTSLIYTNQVTVEHFKGLEDISGCPTFFQRLISKSFDVRVTWLDGKYFSVKLERLTNDGVQIVDIRRDNMKGVKYTLIEMPVSVGSALSDMLSSYELRFAAIDFVVDHVGNWFFLEINPNGQWAWLDLAGITDIAGRFLDIFHGAGEMM